MNPYSKSYRAFLKGNSRKEKTGASFIIITGVFLLDLIFSILVIFQRILSLICFKIAPVILKLLFYNFIFKKMLLTSYRVILSVNRRQKNIFLNQSSKFSFLFGNRYISHTVAVLIIFISIAQNINTFGARAEDLGSASIFAKLSKGQNLTEEITEEEIIISDDSFDKTNNIEKVIDIPPGVSQKLNIEEPVNKNTIALSQEGSAIIKPDIYNTIDTPKPRDSIITYTVKPNDTIFDIAEEFLVNVNSILWANKLSAWSIIRPGDTLKILPVSGVEHIVKNGETISNIAVKYNIPIEDIMEINKLAQDQTLQIGQSLIIPDGKPLYNPPPKRRLAQDFYEPIGLTGGTFFWPTTCRKITQYFLSWRHAGIDIACGFGQNIYASEDGVVEKAGWNSGGYGNRIIIKHSDGVKTLYGHLKTGGILVSPGQYVKKGELIGYMGSTGRSTGPHVHFEIIINGTRINPFNRVR